MFEKTFNLLRNTFYAKKIVYIYMHINIHTCIYIYVTGQFTLKRLYNNFDNLLLYYASKRKIGIDQNRR